MTQKHIVVIIFVLLLVGVGAAGVSKFKSEIDRSLTPSPTPKPVDFSALKGNNITPTTQPTPSPTKLMIKQYHNFPGILSTDQLANKKVVIQTKKGNIEFEVYPEASRAASNFLILTSEKFYDGLIFHRVVPGFVIQGGDPLGNGSGGPGYQFPDEPVTRKYDKGIVAMANSGPNTNGSQFFIMLEDNPNLPPNYTIFGKVISGQEVVGKIQVGDIMERVIIQALK